MQHTPVQAGKVFGSMLVIADAGINTDDGKQMLLVQNVGTKEYTTKPAKYVYANTYTNWHGSSRHKKQARENMLKYAMPQAHTEKSWLKTQLFNLNVALTAKGVSYDKSGKSLKRWRSYVTINGKRISLGRYLTEREAVNARKEKGIPLIKAKIAEIETKLDELNGGTN